MDDDSKRTYTRLRDVNNGRPFAWLDPDVFEHHRMNGTERYVLAGLYATARYQDSTGGQEASLLHTPRGGWGPWFGLSHATALHCIDRLAWLPLLDKDQRRPALAVGDRGVGADDARRMAPNASRRIGADDAPGLVMLDALGMDRLVFVHREEQPARMLPESGDAGGAGERDAGECSEGRPADSSGPVRACHLSARLVAVCAPSGR